MARIPIGLELYSVRHDLERDTFGTLKAVAAMGYEGVEFAGPPKHSGKDLAEMLQKTGLVCCGWHTPWNLVQDDTLAATIELNQAVGNRTIIIPGLPGKLVPTLADWRKMAAVFNRLADKLAAHGMVTGYHNHHTEFTPKEGSTPWDAFFGVARPGSVVMQMDVGNALRGGADVMGILKRYPGRCQTIHLKPYSTQAGKDNPEAGFRPLIGEDEIPWQQLFAFCESEGKTAWYIVEYESDAFPPLDAVNRCLKALKEMGR